jgi:4a-hydroxytetrahydrobiopterin dehydratase
MKKLTEPEIKQRLNELHGWNSTPEGIRKRYELESFAAVIRMVHEVAQIAEQLNHHPDILISYDKVTFTIMTHDIGGITQKDFDLASRIDRL